MILGSMLPNIYVSDFLVPPYTPPPPPQHILSPSVCTLFRNNLFYFCCLALLAWFIFHGLYNVPRFLFSPGGLTYVPSPGVSYFRCFALSLICTFVVSYFHTPVVSHFMVLSILHRSFVRGYLYSRVQWSPVSMFPSTYVPRSPCYPVLCSPIIPGFHGRMFPGLYAPHYLCSPIPMFPITYVSRSLCSPVPCSLYLDFTVLCSRSLCSPLLMFPNTYITWSYAPRSLCSPVPMFPNPYVPQSYVLRYLDFTALCSPVSMFPSTYVPRAHISPNGIYTKSGITHRFFSERRNKYKMAMAGSSIYAWTKPQNKTISQPAAIIPRPALVI